MDQKRRDEEPAELALHTSPVLRLILIAIGWVTLSLGIVGVFLPVLPTTPFVLLAAACFARSSPRFYHRLMNDRYLGPYLRAWRNERRIPLRAKILATVMLAITLIPSALFLIPVFAVKILVLAIGTAVLIYIWRFPS